MKVCPIFFTKQYIGHARHEGPYMENSIPLFEYLIDELKYDIVEADIVFTKDNVPVLNHSTSAKLYKEGVQYDVDISAVTLVELLDFSVVSDSQQKIATAEEFIKLGRRKNKCIMLDMTFQRYTFLQYKKMYRLVKLYNMQERVIWGDPNIFKLAIINKSLICQFSGSWGRKLLIFTFLKSYFCSTTIMSFSYYGGEVENFKNIVKWGHKLGFIMKVATINDESTAEKFWKIGTDLINTDILINK